MSRGGRAGEPFSVRNGILLYCMVAGTELGRQVYVFHAPLAQWVCSALLLGIPAVVWGVRALMVRLNAKGRAAVLLPLASFFALYSMSGSLAMYVGERGRLPSFSWLFGAWLFGELVLAAFLAYIGYWFWMGRTVASDLR